MSLKLLLTLVVLGCASVFIIGLCCHPKSVEDRIVIGTTSNADRGLYGSVIIEGLPIKVDRCQSPPPDMNLSILYPNYELKWREIVIDGKTYVVSYFVKVGGDSLKLKR